MCEVMIPNAKRLGAVPEGFEGQLKQIKDLVLRSSRSERREGRVRTLPGETKIATPTMHASASGGALAHSSFETASFARLRTPPQDEVLCFPSNAIAVERTQRKWILGVLRATFASSALSLLLVALAGAAARAQTAQEIIAGADKVRNPGEPFRTTTTLTEYASGTARGGSVLVVYAKVDKISGQFRDLVRYVEPPRDAGKMALLDGTVLWFYDPASKASVRISPQQRLIGQASIGDVLTVNLALDYAGTILGAESIQDSARKSHDCWHLDMKAANDHATYNRVEYWIEKQTFYPIKAKFYSDSGRLLKILYYGSFAERLGGVRPTEAIIIDAVDTALVTKIGFGDYRTQDIPETWFQRDYLPRLRID
jgi:outer membrane lipoprotein-sorting protein